MGKLMGGLGLCMFLCSVEPTLGQDPFQIQRYESRPGEAPSKFLESPPPQQELPIIQTLPAGKPTHLITQRPLTSRKQNAQVRSARTPAQNYIYQRAAYRAKQRTARMEQRKWRGESLLRPNNYQDHSWWYDYSPPTWAPTHTR